MTLAVIGFFVSWHIHQSKKGGSKLVCLIGKGKHTCSEVVESEYGKTLGISNESLGMAYYTAVIILAVVLWLSGEAAGGVLHTIALVVSGGAFLMSLYLSAIQAFVLKKFCEWCLVTVLANTLIFLIFAYSIWR
jgi:uncharacterized membrane protein